MNDKQVLILKLGREAAKDRGSKTLVEAESLGWDEVERFYDLAIKEHCERMARAIEAMPFGATSDSFAIFVREFK